VCQKRERRFFPQCLFMPYCIIVVKESDMPNFDNEAYFADFDRDCETAMIPMLASVIRIMHSECFLV